MGFATLSNKLKPLLVHSRLLDLYLSTAAALAIAPCAVVCLLRGIHGMHCRQGGRTPGYGNRAVLEVTPGLYYRRK